MYKKITRFFCMPPGYINKFLLIMKLTTFILLVSLLQVSAAGFAQKITLTTRNAHLEDIFKDIRKQSGYDFIYTGKLISKANLVTVKIKDASIEDALKACFDGQPLDFTIEQRTVIVKEKKNEPILKISAPFSIQLITGKVIDDIGLPMPGVNVKVTQVDNRMASQVVTNSTGDFSISCNNTDSVQFSFVGYLTKKYLVSSLPNPLVITMKTSVGQLDQVQVIAYGTTTRRLSTSDISTVNAADIAKQPVGNILLAIQGRVPGMSIVENTGIPGAAPSVKIRGTNSIGAGLAPLYILDGVPIPETQIAINGSNLGANGISALEGINPSDVESISILKDADATAIYGSRGANGVILITTKKGKSGAATVNFTGYTGFSKVAHFVDMLNVHQYDAMRREALKNNSIVPTAANSPDLFTWDTTRVHNWQKELIGGTARTNNANISVSGGSGGNTIYANAGYQNQGSVFPGAENNIRKSARINDNYVSPNGKLTMGIISGYSISTLNLQGLDLTSAIFNAPAYPLYTATGAPNYQGQNGFPYAYTLQPFHSETDTYNGGAIIGYKVLTGLNIKFNAGFNNAVISQRQTNPLSSLDPTQNTSGNLATGDFKNNTWNIEPQITYDARYKKSTFNFLAGTTFLKTTTTSATARGTNYTNEALINNIGSAGTVSYNSSDSQYAYTSLFGRMTYNYDEEYLANVSYRRDGSSRFGPADRFGNFGSVGLGWIFTKEDFIKNALPFLSYGKIRGSYGINGNDQIGDYQYISTYSVASATSNTSYQGVALSSGTLANPDFRWEQDKKLEFGLELGAFKDRILASASFFRNRTDNELIGYVLPPQTGFTSYQANFPALLQNEGWEFTLNTINIDSKSFTWRTSLNAAFSKNKLLSFPGIQNTSYAQSYFVGKSITSVQGFVFNGLSNTGIPTYKDLNGDGSITTADRIILGNKDPFTGGMSNDFRYKDFVFSFFIDYSRFSGYNPAIFASRSGNIGANRSTQVLSRWQNPGDELTTSTPLFTTSTATYVARNFLQSNVNFLNENIFRIRNASLSYNLPYTWIHNIKLQNVKVFVEGQNLFTFNQKGDLLDPETGNSVLPPLRTISFGINVTF
jgi:TonB-linked SusC/RagA family outer membrane protein